MKKLKKLWRSFVYERSKGERVWVLLSVLAAILSIVLLPFIPLATTLQNIIVICFAGVVIYVFCDEFYSGSWATYLPDTLIDIGWCTLVAVIIWMFPISIFWSLIPFGIAIFLLSSLLDTDKIPWLSIVCSTMLLAFLFSYSQDNLNIKRHLQSNPQSEVVTISNFDSGEVFFINEQTSHLKFHSLKTQQDAINLNLHKGDTVKIVRHPNNPKLVIKISK